MNIMNLINIMKIIHIVNTLHKMNIFNIIHIIHIFNISNISNIIINNVIIIISIMNALNIVQKRGTKRNTRLTLTQPDPHVKFSSSLQVEKPFRTPPPPPPRARGFLQLSDQLMEVGLFGPSGGERTKLQVDFESLG